MNSARLRALADALCDSPDLTEQGADLMIRLSFTARYGRDPGPMR